MLMMYSVQISKKRKKIINFIVLNKTVTVVIRYQSNKKLTTRNSDNWYQRVSTSHLSRHRTSFLYQMTQFANFLPGTSRRISVIDLPRLSCRDSSKPIYDKGLPVFYLDCRYYMQLAIYAYYKIKSYNILLE